MVKPSLYSWGGRREGGRRRKEEREEGGGRKGGEREGREEKGRRRFSNGAESCELHTSPTSKYFCKAGYTLQGATMYETILRNGNSVITAFLHSGNVHTE